MRRPCTFVTAAIGYPVRTALVRSAAGRSIDALHYACLQDNQAAEPCPGVPRDKNCILATHPAHPDALFLFYLTLKSSPSSGRARTLMVSQSQEINPSRLDTRRGIWCCGLGQHSRTASDAFFDSPPQSQSKTVTKKTVIERLMFVWFQAL